jgi:hypothetical protein
MTKIQMQQKLALLPLLAPIEVGEETDEDGVPQTVLLYDVPSPGTGSVELKIHVNHTEIQLRDLVNNLPLAEEDRLASLAIMLVPVSQGV